MGRTFERLWVFGTLAWLVLVAGFLWGWPMALSAFDRPPGSALSQQTLTHLREAFVFSFVVVPPVLILSVGWLLDAALRLFQGSLNGGIVKSGIGDG